MVACMTKKKTVVIVENGCDCEDLVLSVEIVYFSVCDQFWEEKQRNWQLKWYKARCLVAIKLRSYLYQTTKASAEVKMIAKYLCSAQLYNSDAIVYV